jgi:hypothetical protein
VYLNFIGVILMPLYDVRIVETGEETELLCSYSSLKEKVDAGEVEILHKRSPMLVTHVGGTLKQTSDGWKDILKQTKRYSGRDNTIKV